MSNPIVFFDISIGGQAAGRIEMTVSCTPRERERVAPQHAPDLDLMPPDVEVARLAPRSMMESPQGPVQGQNRMLHHRQALEGNACGRCAYCVRLSSKINVKKNCCCVDYTPVRREFCVSAHRGPPVLSLTQVVVTRVSQPFSESTLLFWGDLSSSCLSI